MSELFSCLISEEVKIEKVRLSIAKALEILLEKS